MSNTELNHSIAKIDVSFEQDWNELFARRLEEFDQMLNRQFEAFETHIYYRIENDVIPLLKFPSEKNPDTSKSYRQGVFR